MHLAPAPARTLTASGWVDQLPQTFAACGLDVVVEQRIPFRKACRLPWSQGMLAGIEETSAMCGDESVKQAKSFV